jgi:hypothetical protein
MAMEAAAAPVANAGLTENAAGALCYLGGLVTGIIFLVIAPYNQNLRSAKRLQQASLAIRRAFDPDSPPA